MRKHRVRGEGVVFIGVLCMVAVLGWFVQSRTTTVQKEVSVAFADLGIAEFSGTIERFGTFKRDYYNREKQEQLLLEYASKVGILENRSFSFSYDEGRQITHLVGAENGIAIEAKFITAEEVLSEHILKTKQYVMVKLQGDDVSANMNEYKMYIDQFMDDYTSGGETAINLSGNMTGILTEQEMETLKKQFFKEVQAKEVEMYQDEKMYTSYGYTKQYQELYEIGEEKINVNIAMKPQEDTGVTKVYIGIPFITQSY